MDRKGNSNGFKPKKGGINGRSDVLDGEIVGAAAPELGIENRGRSMLEKMGWSKGMALGSLSNQGILQQVVSRIELSFRM